MLKFARVSSLVREILSGFSFYLIFPRLSSRMVEEGGDETDGVENNLDVPFETQAVP